MPKPKRPNHHSIRLSNFLQFEKTPTYASQIKPLFNIQTFKVQSTIISDALLSVLVPRMARPTSGRRCCGPDKYAKSSRTFCQQEKAARSSSNSHLMMQLPSSVVLLLCGRVRTSRLWVRTRETRFFFSISTCRPASVGGELHQWCFRYFGIPQQGLFNSAYPRQMRHLGPPTQKDGTNQQQWL